METSGPRGVSVDGYEKAESLTHCPICDRSLTRKRCGGMSTVGAVFESYCRSCMHWFAIVHWPNLSAAYLGPDRVELNGPEIALARADFLMGVNR